MKTLFLLGILSTLVVIALKQPDQTAWQAANQLIDQVQNISDVRKATNNRLPVERKTIAEKKVNPVVAPPQPVKPVSPPSAKPDPIDPEGSRTRETQSPRKEEIKQPVEVQTADVGPEKTSGTTEKTTELTAEATEKPEVTEKPKVELPKLEEIEVKESPVVHFPKEALDNGPKQLADTTPPDYGAIRRRYRNTIDILGKIQ